jgi:hypothetical protein
MFILMSGSKQQSRLKMMTVGKRIDFGFGENKVINIPMHYILEGKIAKPVDILTWMMWYEKADRTVARTEVGNVIISTIFLGLDAALLLGSDDSFEDGYAPLLFETMVLGGEMDGYKIRCATWETAEELHEKTVEEVKTQDDILSAEFIG